MEEDKRQQLIDLLVKKVAVVRFTKADGTVRVMNCTLNPEVLPKLEVLEEKQPRAVNPDILRVWDTDLRAWRSFRLDRVIDWSYTLA